MPPPLPVGHAPSVAGGLVFVPGLDKRLYAVDAATGQQKWAFEAGAGFFCNPLVVDGTSTSAASDGNVYALSAADGKRKWTFATGGPIYFSPAFDDGKVYIGSTDMYGYALDAATGKQVWKTDKLPGKSMNSFWPVVAQKAGAVIFVMDNAYRAQQLAGLDHEVKAKTWPWMGQRRSGASTRMSSSATWSGSRSSISSSIPHRQTFLVIDSATGKQKQYRPGADGGQCRHADAADDRPGRPVLHDDPPRPLLRRACWAAVTRSAMTSRRTSSSAATATTPWAGAAWWAMSRTA